MTLALTDGGKPDPSGRVMLITGASTGIGAATARRAAEVGYRVVLAARSANKLDVLADDLGGDERALAVPCDVTDPEQQRTLIDRTIERFGRLDVAFVNAGFITGSPFYGGEDTFDAWREMTLTNVFGAAVTARIALPELVETEGQLVLTSSVAGRVPIPGEMYSATKWAVTGMGRSIRAQMVGTGVRVTLIEPGRVDTPFYDETPDEPLLMDGDIAEAVMYAAETPSHVDINEILLRPTGQEI